MKLNSPKKPIWTLFYVFINVHSFNYDRNFLLSSKRLVNLGF